MEVAYITHPDCLLHDMGPQHPEQPARLNAINDRLIASGRDAVLTHVEAPLATLEQLERVHAPRYVADILAAAPEGGWGVDGLNAVDRNEPGPYVHLDPDTWMNRHTAQAALRAAGAAVAAVDFVFDDPQRSRRAFCAVRPPGHHACYDRAMGFCFFNNVAVGAAHAIAEHGTRRVAILDFDVHHGNGTEDIVLRMFSAEVLFCSVFQHPFYPYSGADIREPNVVNVPLPALTRGEAFRAAIEEQWGPAIEAFSPELVMVSAGFDGHAADDMSHWLLLDEDYAWVTGFIVEAADRHSGGRLISMLEGGYELGALARCVTEHVGAMM